MESAKLYVGNLPFSATEDELRNLFAQAGDVSEIRLITDRETGRPKGFGFITMGSEDSATEAMDKFNGYDMGGRKLRIDKARPSTGGGGGGRGGRPSGRGGGFRDQR